MNHYDQYEPFALAVADKIKSVSNGKYDTAIDQSTFFFSFALEDSEPARVENKNFWHSLHNLKRKAYDLEPAASLGKVRLRLVERITDAITAKTPSVTPAHRAALGDILNRHTCNMATEWARKYIPVE